MKLATIRTPSGTVAARVDSAPSPRQPGVAYAIPGYKDVGELLLSDAPLHHAERTTLALEFVWTDLAPVVPRPEKIICVGLNYARHIREMNREFPDHPTLFIKFADSLTGPFDDVVIPPRAQAKLDYEGELAVVIGTRAHEVSREDSLDFVAGYSIMNDYTLRDFQRRTSQFHQGKSFYRTAGFGPWLTTADEWAPGSGAMLTTTVDGEVRQHDNTDDLIFSVAELVEFCSHLYPLNPGDVIVTGTPEGVGFARDPQAFLQDKQVVRIAIEGLGHVANQTIFS